MVIFLLCFSLKRNGKLRNLKINHVILKWLQSLKLTSIETMNISKKSLACKSLIVQEIVFGV